MNVEQAKNLYAAIDLVRFPLKAKLSPQELMLLIAPIGACIDKAATGNMEYQWSGECRHALKTVQRHCLDIVEQIAITTGEITAARQQELAAADTKIETQAKGIPIRVFFDTPYGKKHAIDCQPGTHIDDICDYIAAQDSYTYTQTWTYRGKIVSGTIGESNITNEATVTMLQKAPDGGMPMLFHNRFPEWARAISAEPWTQNAKYIYG